MVGRSVGAHSGDCGWAGLREKPAATRRAPGLCVMAHLCRNQAKRLCFLLLSMFRTLSHFRFSFTLPPRSCLSLGANVSRRQGCPQERSPGARCCDQTQAHRQFLNCVVWVGGLLFLLRLCVVDAWQCCQA